MNFGKLKYADVLKAESLGGGWRAGLERFRCEADSGETGDALATAKRLNAEYPAVNAVKLAYARALLAAQRFSECVAFLEKCVILPSEYGENAEGIWREACYALGDIEKAESYPENLGAGKPFRKDNRPYEFKRANRVKDDVEPLVGFEDGAKWKGNDLFTKAGVNGQYDWKGAALSFDAGYYGLHQRDNAKLLKTLQDLRDLGNTLIVVEHDEDTMRAADYIVDIGPGAGIHGGEIVATGTPEEVARCERSYTGIYLKNLLGK